ncbi:hypothetical protein [Nocardiopsis aegyptia]|uniref:Uncharacterized protein n=1 Tax=Nocardiopsis aegyptia TaxID=220378 RepID=A0A7Z0EV82_9ACTN|nr:hypothetical protein [Nocardiopsis aegyptia]NYJ37918.1 hypothetical protein [Nocardiopsis aegyptia]
MKRLTSFLRTRLGLPRDDHGYSTETVVVIALLVAMAIAAVGFISATVEKYASNITLG